MLVSHLSGDYINSSLDAQNSNKKKDNSEKKNQECDNKFWLFAEGCSNIQLHNPNEYHKPII